jgi:hypothetical protein
LPQPLAFTGLWTALSQIELTPLRQALLEIVNRAICAARRRLAALSPSVRRLEQLLGHGGVDSVHHRQGSILCYRGSCRAKWPLGPGQPGRDGAAQCACATACGRGGSARFSTTGYSIAHPAFHASVASGTREQIALTGRVLAETSSSASPIALDVPVRERNTLFTSEGLSPAFAARDLSDQVMSPAKLVLDRVLQEREPG